MTLRLAPIPKDPEALREDNSIHLVDKAFLDASIDQWDTAISLVKPVPQTSEVEQVFYVTFDEVLTAPRGEAEEIVPTETYIYDGVRSLTNAELQEQLDILTRQVIRTQVPVRFPLEILPLTQGVQRVYVFKEPVQEALNVQGELKTMDTEGNAILWQPGVETRFLVEDIASDIGSSGNEIDELLTCLISGGEAVWSRPDDIIVESEENAPQDTNQ